jgi:hypothetical protein
MRVYQRQIVEVPFNLYQGVRNHPALILSADDIIEMEDAFTAVMLTSVRHNDDYTFEISNAMLESGSFTRPHSEIRLHLVSYFKISETIINHHSNTKVKAVDFSRIIRRIVQVTFAQNVA